MKATYLQRKVFSSSLHHYSLITAILFTNGLFSPQIHALTAPTEQLSIPKNTPTPITPQECAAIEADATRLACYDTAFNRHTTIETTPTLATNTHQTENNTKPSRKTDFFSTTSHINPTTSLLDRRWELSPTSKLGTFTLRANRPVYFLPSFYTSTPNKLPTSPNPDNRASSPLDIDHNEAKFQLSLKAKALENILNTNGDLWFGYTQTSHWQIFNAENSRPFRETNYEPEASLIFPTDYNFFGLNGRLLGFTLDHQSNGRSTPLSRSWNRAMLNIGLEHEDWVVMLRPWYRIPEDKSGDDNSDMSNYIGRGDIQITHRWNGHEFSLMLRHSLKGGADSHGAAQFDWSFPIHNNLRGFAQIFTGYGESLIDYNYDSTSVGLGISLLNWY